MEAITIKTAKKKEAKFALIGYSNKELRLFNIEKGILKEEKPFIKKDILLLKKLIESVDEDFKELSGKIPNELIFMKNNTLIWVFKAKKKKLFFAKNLEIESKEYDIPNLIFKYDNGLKVYALKRYRKSDNEILYNAPFLNVNSSGNVCMGNTETSIKDKTSIKDAINFLENSFFNSVFTHTNSAVIMKKNIIELYKNNQLTDTKNFIKNENKRIGTLCS